MTSERAGRKRERTRQAIKEAAIALAMERDFQLVSLEDVADRADVARGTIYNLYSRKENLLVEIVSPLMRGMADAMDALVRKGAVPLDGVTGLLADAWSRDRGGLGLMLRIRGDAMGALRQDHERLVAACVAAFDALQEGARLRTARPRDAAYLLFRVAVPALEALDPGGGAGRAAFVKAMRGLLLA
jgi:AcrR family transcriptional regulator